jgi:hypothetical protein
VSVQVLSTVLVAATSTPPASPYDLTDLTTVHDELSIPTQDSSNDAFLQRAITQTSQAIATYCNRVFAVEALQDVCYIEQDPYPYQVPAGFNPLQLSRWPIVHSTVVAFSGNTHGNQTVDGISSIAGLVVGMLVFAAGLPPGTKIQTVTPPDTITLTKAATSSESGLSFSTGLQVVQTLGTQSAQTLVAGQDYSIDPEHGWLIRLNPFTGVATTWEALPTTVQYQAGYSPLPADLVDAVLRTITGRFRARGRDPMLVERSQPQTLGSERFWVGVTPGQSGAFPPEIEALIAQYRVPINA